MNFGDFDLAFRVDLCDFALLDAEFQALILNYAIEL
jgi:hypothetical protein